MLIDIRKQFGYSQSLSELLLSVFLLLGIHGRLLLRVGDDSWHVADGLVSVLSNSLDDLDNVFIT